MALQIDQRGYRMRKAIIRNQQTGMVYPVTACLVISLAYVAITFFLLARHTRQEQQWISLVTTVQVTSQQTAKSASEAAMGNLSAFLELGVSRSRINTNMDILRSGSVSRSLPVIPSAVEAQMNQLEETWKRISNNASRILSREKLLVELTSTRAIIEENIPDIQKNIDANIRTLTQGRAATSQVIFASRQQVLADRILRRVTEVLQGGSNTLSAVENLNRDRDLFGQILNALLKGDPNLGVTQVRNINALQFLAKIKTRFETITPEINAIVNASNDLFEVSGAAEEISLDSRDMFEEAANLNYAIAHLAQKRLWPSQMTGILGLVVMISFVWLLVYLFLSAERRRAKLAARSNEKNQTAIMKLLDELSPLADGDLTVHATVSGDITAEIAESVNFAIEQLRELVQRIKYTAQEVAGSAMETRISTSELAKATVVQAEQVGEATKSVQQMAKSFDDMAKRSSESKEAARDSVTFAHTGGEKVRETIDGMDTIREQIQQTSKRIKRLGESTQEIGDIVELINGFAEQTNVLALNAAIQAASAGGSGKGFAVVADEVQQLAESASSSTRRIETLVQTIQTDTFEAVVSMESTISEVVRGARVAEDAGTALEKIERVSNDLSRQIAGISEEAHTQSATATDIAKLMRNVQNVSIKASTGSSQAANSVEKLAGLVMRLRDSVTDFKLPEED